MLGKPTVAAFIGLLFALDVQGQCPQNATTLCIPLDGTFTLAQMGGAACGRNDDLSTASIPLQFGFNLYGTVYNSVFINNNGNLTFTGPYGVYTASGFPLSGVPMVAPFWADVDTRNTASGVVWYKSEPNRFTVIWDHVGYYNSQANLLNTFECIISDGTDPLVGLGDNVCFCYDNMDWTTGSASGGVGGFGGTPATVGVNAGSGGNFFQMGRFGLNNANYDGPGGATDGVHYLDNRVQCLAVDTLLNIAPVSFNLPPGNRFNVAPFQTLNFTINWNGPELNQQIVGLTVNHSLANFTCDPPVFGTTGSITCHFSPDCSQIGSNCFTMTATDDHPTNPLSTTITLCMNVTPTPSGVLDLLTDVGPPGSTTYNLTSATPKPVVPGQSLRWFVGQGSSPCGNGTPLILIANIGAQASMNAVTPGVPGFNRLHNLSSPNGIGFILGDGYGTGFIVGIPIIPQAPNFVGDPPWGFITTAAFPPGLEIRLQAAAFCNCTNGFAVSNECSFIFI